MNNPFSPACWLATYTLSVVCLASCQENKLDRIERESREYTERNCPQVLDSLVTLDSIVFHNDGSNDFVYCYSVKNVDGIKEAMAENEETLRSNYLSSIRNSVDLKNIKAEGLNIVYRYSLADTNEQLAEFSFSKSDYGK